MLNIHDITLEEVQEKIIECLGLTNSNLNYQTIDLIGRDDKKVLCLIQISRSRNSDDYEEKVKYLKAQHGIEDIQRYLFVAPDRERITIETYANENNIEIEFLSLVKIIISLLE